MPSNEQIIEAAVRKIRALNVTHEIEFGDYNVRFYYPTPDCEMKYAVKVTEDEANAIVLEDGAEPEFDDHEHNHDERACPSCMTVYRLGKAESFDRARMTQEQEMEQLKTSCADYARAKEELDEKLSRYKDLEAEVARLDQESVDCLPLDESIELVRIAYRRLTGSYWEPKPVE